MNEEIRTNEIAEEELESVSGGVRIKREGVCALCGANAYNKTVNGKTRLVCSVCGHTEE